MKHSGDVSFIFLLPKAKSQIGHTVCVKIFTLQNAAAFSLGRQMRSPPLVSAE